MNKQIFSIKDVLLIFAAVFGTILICGAFFHLGISYGRNHEELYLEEEFSEVLKPMTGCDCEGLDEWTCSCLDDFEDDDDDDDFEDDDYEDDDDDDDDFECDEDDDDCKYSSISVPGKIISDDFVKNQVLMSFVSGTSDKEIKKVLSSIKDMKSYDAEYDTYVITLKKEFKDRNELRNFCSSLVKNNKTIEFCEANNIIRLDDCSKGPC